MHNFAIILISVPSDFLNMLFEFSFSWYECPSLFLAEPAASLDDKEDDIFRNAPNLRREFPSSTDNPRITEHPQDDYFAKNEPATLHCNAEGDPPPIITWYKDGELVETTRSNPASHRMLLDNGQLFFLRVIHTKNNQPDVGEYYCNATNIHGTAISQKALVQIAGKLTRFLTLISLETFGSTYIQVFLLILLVFAWSYNRGTEFKLCCHTFSVVGLFWLG